MADLNRIGVRAGASDYPVLVGRGALASLPSALEQARVSGRLRIIVDERIAPLHVPRLLECLGEAEKTSRVLEISGRERDKTLATVSGVYDWLIEVGTDRKDIVVSFGGGVIGDMVGFAAATFLRGVRLVHLPTTLLAMVDSSIGGKTGVNHSAGKNLIGAFYQPSLVLADLDLLATLPRRELLAGWAEVVKMGVVRSAELFSRLEGAADRVLALEADAAWAIARAIELKGQIVAADERESDLRMILNYGHTIGHAVEAATGFGRFLHGEAVAIGMTGAAEIAHRTGQLTAGDRERQATLLARFGLPARCPGLTVDDLWRPMRHDKKAVGERLRWVLPTGIGSAEVVDSVADQLVSDTLDWLIHN